MRLYQYLNEQSSYNNWTFPSDKTIKEDFNEYKKKEERKWKRRAQTIGMRFPIFDTLSDFKSSLKNAEVITVTERFDSRIMNRSHTSSIEDLKNLVSGYVRPRDVDRIVQGFENDDKIPYPIILKGSKGMWIMAGNTRLDAAFIMGVTPKALLVDVSEE